MLTMYLNVIRLLFLLKEATAEAQESHVWPQVADP